MVANIQRSKRFSRDYLIIIIWALALSIIAVVLSSHINSLAFNTQPMIGDNAYQYGYSAFSYLDYLYSGRLAAISSAYLNYPRPIWAIIPLVINPNLLINLNGHIFVGGIFLFSFLSIMGIAIFKRTRLISYAFACMMAVLAAANFFHYRLGMGGNYTDLQTAWLIGAALFSLINSDEGTRAPWLILFGLFSALAQQSRFVSIGVTAIVCGPILVYYLLKRWKQERNAKSILVPLLQAIAPIILISGYSIITYMNNYIYAVVYSPVVTSGVIHLYKPVNVALALFLRVYDYHLGVIGIMVLLSFCILYFFLYWRERNNNGSLAISLWAAIAFLLTHIFILRVADEWIYIVYMLPGFYLFAFLPFDISPQKIPEINSKLKLHKVLSICGMVGLLIISFINFERVSKSVTDVSELDRQIVTYRKDVSTFLTGLIKQYYPNVRTKEDVPTFESFVEIRDLTSAEPINIETWYHHSQPIQWVNLSLVWKSLYEANYPNLSLEEIQKIVYQKTLNQIDFVIVLSDPRNEKAVRLSKMYPELEGDEWNLKVNEYIYEQVSVNKSDWIEEPLSGQLGYNSPFGNIHIFRNLDRYEKRNQKAQ